jgi:hypothetical protein
MRTRSQVRNEVRNEARELNLIKELIPLKEFKPIKEFNPIKELKPLYEVNIDFDGASEAWKANKKSVGNGCYKYVCCKVNKKGLKCDKICYKNIDYCWSHRATTIL